VTGKRIAPAATAVIGRNQSREVVAATIDQCAKALREELASWRVLVGDLRGKWNDGKLRTTDRFLLPAGRRLPASDPIVRRYRSHFRRLPRREIELGVSRAVKRWRYEAEL
jgi:hypothetical protein